MPGGREKRYLLARFKGSRDVVVSLIGPILAWHTGGSSTGGTSTASWDAITSTPYWWGLAGLCLRICHYLLIPATPIELLLYADDLEAMGFGSEGRKAALGSALKWSKQRGGLCSERVGLQVLFFWPLCPEVGVAGGMDEEHF